MTKTLKSLYMRMNQRIQEYNPGGDYLKICYVDCFSFVPRIN